ncbi:MAG TPA: (2Fe-2S)-binding protein [Jatrophihabitans sp.]|nr:(2Fe-2S)-binding protein [Jatrophihabitans sp.]
MQSLASQLRSLGPFFAVELHPAGTPLPGSWRPLAELVTDPAALPARIAAVRSVLASGSGLPDDAVERRVAASAVLLGLAARLLSPALAAAVLDGVLLDLALDGLGWQPAPGSAFPLAVPAEAPRPGPAEGVRPGPAGIDGLAAGLADLLTGPIRQLVDAVDAACRLSPLVAWGNVGSAINGAAIVLGQRRPELAARTYRLAAAVLARPPLGMTDPVAGPGFRRTSCCLRYRLAPGDRTAVCADCVLLAVPNR